MGISFIEGMKIRMIFLQLWQLTRIKAFPISKPTNPPKNKQNNGKTEHQSQQHLQYSVDSGQMQLGDCEVAGQILRGQQLELPRAEK